MLAQMLEDAILGSSSAGAVDDSCAIILFFLWLVFFYISCKMCLFLAECSIVVGIDTS